MPRLMRRTHGIHHVLSHVVALRVDRVVARIVLLDQPKGVDAHLELDLGPVHAVSLELREQVWREVQPCRRGSGRMLFSHGKDGLVLLGISLVVGDVGRQRHMSDGVDRIVERASSLRLKADDAASPATLHEVEHRADEHRLGRIWGQKAAGPELHRRPLPQPPAWMHEALPGRAERIQVLPPA